jgi:predicted GIY-YIG superfamily endonuclease
VPVVYLLRCVDGSLYCGWSVDLGRRLAAHRTGRASRYTASRRPVKLAAAWETGTATEARRLEARIKRLTRAEKLRLVAASRAAPAPWGLRPIKFFGQHDEAA